MVIDELLSRGRIGRWIRQRTPADRPIWCSRSPEASLTFPC